MDETRFEACCVHNISSHPPQTEKASPPDTGYELDWGRNRLCQTGGWTYSLGFLAVEYQPGRFSPCADFLDHDRERQVAHPGGKRMAGRGSQAHTNPVCHQFCDKSKGIYLEKTGYESYDIHGMDDPDDRKALSSNPTMSSSRSVCGPCMVLLPGSRLRFLDDSDEMKQSCAQKRA
ncbi:MAG: hypothetical protein QM270_00410 [Bacillota bacterium]|nr:hypothetical protein [Bacillota bacterium]